MALTVQNLRAVGVGVEPDSLLPGQIAFNITDKVLYVGDGSSFKTSFDGTQVAGVAGAGWYAMPMDFDSLGEYYVANPAYYGDNPTDQQVLTWSTGLNHPIWTSGGGGGGGSFVYVVSNADVASAPGATTSAKISAAIGVVSPDEGNVTIVTGLPDDVYQGLYFFTTEWTRGASYAYPSASEVIYDNTAHPDLTPTVQGAIGDLDDGLAATTAIANTANSTAISALSIANAALPKAGGTMTGPLRLNSTLVDGVGSPGTSGYVLESTGTGIQWVSNAPGDVTGVTGTAPITVNNADPQNPVVGVSNATTSSTGVVQVGTNINVSGGVISVPPATPTVAGVVFGCTLNSGLGSTAVGYLALSSNTTGFCNVAVGLNALYSNTTGGYNVANGVNALCKNTTGSFNVANGYQSLFNNTTGENNVANGLQALYSNTTGGFNTATGNGALYGNTTGCCNVANGTLALNDNTTGDGNVANGVCALYSNTTGTNNTAIGSNAANAITTGCNNVAVGFNVQLASATGSCQLAIGYDAGQYWLTGDSSKNIKPGAGILDCTNSTGTLGYVLESTGTGIQWVANAPGDVTGVTGTAPITVDNTDPQNPIVGASNATTSSNGVVQVGTNIDVTSGVISVKTGSASDFGILKVGTNLDVAAGVVSVKSASTTQAGIVQLNDTTASSSTTQALTAAQGLNLQTQINSLTVASNTKLAGSLNCATGKVASVTTDGIAQGFVVGNNPPNPAAGNANYYLIVTTASASYSPPGGGGPYAPQNGDWFLSNGTSWQYLGVGARPTYASTTVAGIVQLADDPTTQAGTNSTLAVTPSGLQSKVSDSTSTTSSISIASSTAVKSAYDLANAALPKSGGTMTGDITMSGAGVGIVFDDASTVEAISDSVSSTSSVTAASSTAVKSAYDIGNAALPKAGGTMTGDLTFSGAGVGVVFNDTSTVEAISDSTSTTSSVTAASATAVKSAYDLATTANNTANAALPKAGGTMTGTITFAAGQTFPVSGIQDATIGQKGVVQVGTNIQVSSGTISVNTATTGQLGLVQVGSNIDVSSGTISVKSSSTSQAGIVQLNDTTASTSTTQALTANQGKSLQDQINALSVSSNITFAGTINGSTGNMATVTTEGAAVGFVVGSPLPSPSSTVAEYFVIVSTAGTMTPPGGSATAVQVGDWWLASASTWTYVAAGYTPPAASTTTAGIVALATNAETQTGTNSTKAVVPSALQSKMSDSTSTTSSTTIASSTAVKSAYDLANAAVPKSCYTALGALAAGTGASTVGTLSIGSNGQFLTVNTACASGLQWCALPNGSTTVTGIVQLTDSTSCTGTTTAATPNSVKTAYDLANAAVPKSTVTAKGDLIAATASATVSALPIGTNGQFLAANSACGTGMQWCTLSLACVPCSAFTAAGQILAGTGTSTFTALSVGTNGQLLVADSTCTGGLKWLTSQGINLCGYTCTATPFNTAIGCGAGGAITSSANSTFIGNNAGKSVTSGSSNTSLGTNSACSVSTGARNTGVGHNAIIVIGTGSDNTAVGAFSGQALSTGSSCNTVVGSCALYTNSTGGSNVAIGAGASQNGASGSNNVAVGTQAMQVNTSTGSVAVGFQAMLNNTAGVNVAIGSSALRANTTGTGNTAIGINAGISVTGPNQTIVGYNAGCNITTGDSNSLVGFGAGLGVTTGTCNTVFGFCALTAAGVVNQANNVAIGAFAGAAVTLGANTLVGFCSGASLTGTPANTFIGCGAGRLSTTGQQNTAIGCGAIGSGVTTGSNNFAGGVLAGDALTSGSTNTFLGYTSGRLVTTGGQNTIVGAYGGTTTLANNVVLADGAGTIRFQSNASGAISLGAGGSYGTAGQILVSGGSGAAPTWTSSGTAAANYGSFVRTTTQTNTGGASGNAVSYDTTSSANNFSIVSGSRITAAVAGTYQVLASLQVQKTDAGSDNINFWVKKNGVNEPNSAYNLTLQGSGAAQLGYINWVVTLAAGEYVELWWYSADVNARLLTDPAVAPYPAVPASGFIIHPMGA